MGYVASYKDLIVWQKAIELVLNVYKLTESFPKSEIYGITSQIRRSSISIPSNIAEGRTRATSRDFHHFLSIAYASGAELETQLIISNKLNFGKKTDYQKINIILNEVMRMLNSIIYSIKLKYSPNP